MLVTEIKQQTHNPEKYSVFINGEFAFGLIMEDILYFKIKEGQNLTEEKYNFIMDNLIYIKAQDTALHYISYKMRTKSEVTKKLKEKEYAPDVIEKVLVFLEKYHYVDDFKYCQSYIKQSMKLKPKGTFLLKMELKERGIERDIYEKALEETDIDELEMATALLHKKIKDFSAMDEKKRKQAVSFLQRKGYSYEIIKEAFKKAKNE